MLPAACRARSKGLRDHLRGFPRNLQQQAFRTTAFTSQCALCLRLEGSNRPERTGTCCSELAQRDGTDTFNTKLTALGQ